MIIKNNIRAVHVRFSSEKTGDIPKLFPVMGSTLYGIITESKQKKINVLQ